MQELAPGWPTTHQPAACGLYTLGGLIGALAIGACTGALCASPLYGLAPTVAVDQVEGLIGIGLVLILWRRIYADLTFL